MTDLDLHPANLPAQVSQSVGSVWARHAGNPPEAVETVIRANAIICTISGGTVEFSDGMIASHETSGPAPRPGYTSDAIAAVVDVTGRRVRSLVSRTNSAADVATEIFTLEEPPLRR